MPTTPPAMAPSMTFASDEIHMIGGFESPSPKPADYSAEPIPDVTFDVTSVAFTVTHVTFWPRTVLTHSLDPSCAEGMKQPVW